ncbi:MAG TPA: tRNA 2-thiouridine(34) synthase MnmA [Bacteroidales bacterium]|nr:tRNA 2-thiouridine(34) synthase MnmA [Bacteroidales bacterium]
MEKTQTRVVVGLSGGVDSSAAAWLLKEQGYEVIGIFMRNWHDESVLVSKECPWVEDSTDALMVSEKLEIPFYTFDFSEEYRKRIVDYMFSEYQAGRTPNPDVLCNREIKFDLFLKAAEGLGASFVATGHYCRKEWFEQNGKTIYRLLAGKDQNKDQSYFLCQLRQDQLAKALFPIGHLLKSEVRQIARIQQLVTAEKRDSQGLCFIGKVRLPEFLQQKLKPKKGKIILIPDSFPEAVKPLLPENQSWDTADHTFLDAIAVAQPLAPEMGQEIGEHNGAHFFTIGQRKGLKVGGMKEPLFVAGIDTINNLLYTVQGENHPGLFRYGLFVDRSNINWIREDLRLEPGQSKKYQTRIRYRQHLSGANLVMRDNGLYIIFDKPQKAIAPGQFVAWYSQEECIGSGVIA